MSEKAPAEKLDEHNNKVLQKIVETLLYYARDIYSTILMDLNYIVAVQIKPTIETAKQIHSISKLQRNTSRRNNRIQKKRNDSPHKLQLGLGLKRPANIPFEIVEKLFMVA